VLVDMLLFLALWVVLGGRTPTENREAAKAASFILRERGVGVEREMVAIEGQIESKRLSDECSCAWREMALHMLDSHTYKNQAQGVSTTSADARSRIHGHGSTTFDPSRLFTSSFVTPSYLLAQWL